MFFTSIGAMAFKSRFSVTRDAEAGINTTTLQLIGFTLVTYDNNDEYLDYPDFRWVPKSPGIYSLSAHIELIGMTEGKLCDMTIRKNGVTTVLHDRKEAGSLENLAMQVHGDIVVEAEDYFDVTLYHNNGNTRNIQSLVDCRFWGHRIA